MCYQKFTYGFCINKEDTTNVVIIDKFIVFGIRHISLMQDTKFSYVQ